MSKFNRRDAIRYGFAGLAGGIFAGGFNPLRAAGNLIPPENNSVGKLLTIFVRGGADGMSMLIPAGDTTYRNARELKDSQNNIISSCWIDPASSLSLTKSPTGYAKLRAEMGRLQGTSIENQLAFIHQCGHADGKRSHFTEQQKAEVGADALLTDGWLARLATALNLGALPIATSSHSTLLQQAFKSKDLNTQPILVRDLVEEYKDVGGIISPELIPHLAQNPTDPTLKLVDAMGDLLVAAQQEVANATPEFVHDPIKFPTIGDPLPAGLPSNPAGLQFLGRLEEALYLLQHTSCRVAGVEIGGGWDTHTDQIASTAVLTRYLAWGMREVFDAGSPNILTWVQTEFGRTARVNGNNGTDHGLGGLAMLMGSNVTGQVVNCDAQTHQKLGDTPPKTSSDPDANASPVSTHIFSIYREICQKQFGITDQQTLETIIPGLLTETGPSMVPTNFLA